MSPEQNDDQWVWAVIQEPEKNPQYLGQYDDEKSISFIPAFREKEHGIQCLNLLNKNENLKYEVQAILYDELVKDARKNGFLVVFLNGEGKVLEWIEQ